MPVEPAPVSALLPETVEDGLLEEAAGLLDVSVFEEEELLEDDEADVPSGLSGLLESSSGSIMSEDTDDPLLNPEMLEYIAT